MQRPWLILLFCAVLQCVGATLDLDYDRPDGLALRNERSPHQKTCVVDAGGSNDTDDAPAIRKAFKKCGHGGRVVFKPTTYYVNSVLNVSGLENVDIDILGELSVCATLMLHAGV